MRIAVIGGTGKEGRGLALRWAKAGHDLFIGSRDAARAEATAAELTGLSGREVRGGSNAWAAEQGEIALVSVPYAGHGATLRELAGVLAGRIVIDITVPLAPPRVSEVTLPPGHAAALEAQALLGDRASVVAALHHVGAAHLADAEAVIDCDVLACSNDQAALDTVLGLIGDLGLRGLDAGKLANAVALESLTPVLIRLNKKYKSPGAGVRFTGLEK
ncbi:MAG: NADPH-dependent F420 reductase [Sorangiineae bacterium]|nr:NADPH-dependent F420 reductase [Polyangiaceae bacterium]MEB2323847.1 NADPH-dependent F420 reductase [Sorangiineae bacterium]